MWKSTWASGWVSHLQLKKVTQELPLQSKKKIHRNFIFNSRKVHVLHLQLKKIFNANDFHGSCLQRNFIFCWRNLLRNFTFNWNKSTASKASKTHNLFIQHLNNTYFSTLSFSRKWGSRLMKKAFSSLVITNNVSNLKPRFWELHYVGPCRNTTVEFGLRSACRGALHAPAQPSSRPGPHMIISWL